MSNLSEVCPAVMHTKRKVLIYANILEGGTYVNFGGPQLVELVREWFWRRFANRHKLRQNRDVGFRRDFFDERTVPARARESERHYSSRLGWGKVVGIN
jgi:hypothetical protein